MEERRKNIIDLESRVSAHEQVCAERYQNLLDRMKRVEMVIYAVAGSIAVAFLGIVVNKL